jgi:F-type H+-transporting ATPase subunit gamma
LLASEERPNLSDAQAVPIIVLLPTDYSSIHILYNKFINASSYEVSQLEAFSEEAIANSRKYRRMS